MHLKYLIKHMWPLLIKFWTKITLTLSKAELVGANTVNGPSPARVSTRSAAWTAASRVENCGEATTSSAMFWAGAGASFTTTAGAWWTTGAWWTAGAWWTTGAWWTAGAWWTTGAWWTAGAWWGAAWKLCCDWWDTPVPWWTWPWDWTLATPWWFTYTKNTGVKAR